ncbi:MAG: hypothetical protein ACD_73C00503G0001 [uncultured bacterium]|nr:MAG: hypothetical protein ACD_73C00503G0001 [uncultured bacterium]
MVTVSSVPSAFILTNVTVASVKTVSPIVANLGLMTFDNPLVNDGAAREAATSPALTTTCPVTVTCKVSEAGSSAAGSSAAASEDVAVLPQLTKKPSEMAVMIDNNCRCFILKIMGTPLKN